MYPCPNGNIKGSNLVSKRIASVYGVAKLLERESISPALIFTVPPLNVANESASLNSKSIENLEAVVKVAVNAFESVSTFVEPSYAVISLGASPVPGPVVTLIFAPL